MAFDTYSIINIYQFPNSTSKVIERQTFIKNSQTRVDQILTLASYKDIHMSIHGLKIKLRIDDAKIADWIWKTFKGNTFDPLRGSDIQLSDTDKSDIKAFIANITALLFGTEVSRNLSCLIIHPMIIEL
ncbi:unnamed protein product, partial [Rotaria sordida]